MIKEANRFIRLLNLQKHPEGGYYSEVFRSKETIRKKFLPKRYKGNRNFYSSIYFLLNKNDISVFHKLKSDEIWHFYSGSRLMIYFIENKNKISIIKLGADHKSGDKFKILIKKDTWFAAELEDKKSYALVGCTMSPGFEYEDFELGDRNKLLKQFPKHRSIIEKFTRNN